MTTVLITGASRGIGFTTAYRLAALGWTVFAAARSIDGLAARIHDRAEQVHDAVTDVDVRTVTLDVTDDASVRVAARDVHAAIDVLDVLINNAAIPGTPKAAADVIASDFDDIVQTNVLGPVRVTQQLLPLLQRAVRPRVVMVSSGMGSLTLQQTDDHYRDIAHLPYPAGKAALNMLTVQYAKALPHIIFTAVDPGLTATDFTGGSGHSVEEGSNPIIAAALDTNGPSGRFLSDDGETPW